MSTGQRNVERLRPLLMRLTDAVADNDATQFERLLDDLLRAHRKDLFGELGRLTARARRALERFQVDERLASLAQDIPNVGQRLRHVVTLTDQAAHRTLDLIEKSGPLVDALADSREVSDRRATAARLRGNLSDMLIAQSYQDLTGQIVRGVITLIGEIDAALSGLAALTDGVQPRQRGASPAAVTGTNGYGPVVPGVEHGAAVHNQQDVDALLSGLGL